jgi:CubicO group peptidase (beta-lactamase class C family)
MKNPLRPALSVAVIKDFKVEWARAYGFRDAEEKSPATVETLFQAASISKPVAAAAALRFVEKGRLDLEEDVNAKLASWKVPENEFTAKKKVTLREILSHSSIALVFLKDAQDTITGFVANGVHRAKKID